MAPPSTESASNSAGTIDHEAVLARAVELAGHAPPRAQLGRVRAGTAGWTDPTLVKAGVFYPRGTSSAEAKLRYYASQFSMVEVDSTFYALPAPKNAERWLERTPAGFVFDVKAYAALTEHAVEFSRLPRDLQDALDPQLAARGRAFPRDLPGDLLFEIWKRFKTAVAPLHAAKRLGAVLFQFPPWFAATKANARTIEVCRARMDPLPIAVEFRHASWGEPDRLPRVVKFLKSIGASYVAVDEPQGLPNSMPPVAAVASQRLAVVRFHGRKRSAWNRPGASVQEKFDYLYDPQELAPWAASAQTLANEAEQVHLVFNNCVSNFAVLGARDVMAIIAEHEAARQRQRKAG